MSTGSVCMADHTLRNCSRWCCKAAVFLACSRCLLDSSFCSSLFFNTADVLNSKFSKKNKTKKKESNKQIRVYVTIINIRKEEKEAENKKG